MSGKEKSASVKRESFINSIETSEERESLSYTVKFITYVLMISTLLRHTIHSYRFR